MPIDLTTLERMDWNPKTCFWCGIPVVDDHHHCSVTVIVGSEVRLFHQNPRNCFAEFEKASPRLVAYVLDRKREIGGLSK